jgi:hypothetical protein
MKISVPKIGSLQMGAKAQNDNFLEICSNAFDYILVYYYLWRPSA